MALAKAAYFKVVAQAQKQVEFSRLFKVIYVMSPGEKRFDIIRLKRLSHVAIGVRDLELVDTRDMLVFS